MEGQAGVCTLRDQSRPQRELTLDGPPRSTTPLHITGTCGAYHLHQVPAQGKEHVTHWPTVHHVTIPQLVCASGRSHMTISQQVCVNRRSHMTISQQVCVNGRSHMTISQLVCVNGRSHMTISQLVCVNGRSHMTISQQVCVNGRSHMTISQHARVKLGLGSRIPL